MHELMLAGKKRTPGFEFGDEQEGYMGFVPAADMITGINLAAAIGLTTGQVLQNTDGWLKFSYSGKILYIAKRPFRHALSWSHIYTAGAVYGSGYGRAPSGVASRLQNASVVIGDKTYIVRLLRISSTDPTSLTPSGDEMMALLDRVIIGRSWGKFTTAELAFNYFTLLRETWTTTLANRLAVFYSGSTRSIAQQSATEIDTLYAWRPVLELVP